MKQQPITRSNMTNPATEFKVGNRAWKARSTHGRRPIFENPEQLWDACEQYFQWVEDNPLIATETVKYQGVGTVMEVPKMRAMTLDGLYTFLDIAPNTWANYREKSDFLNICEKVERFIRTQKFEGAAADMLNPSIIARELGLANKCKVDTNLSQTITQLLDEIDGANTGLPSAGRVKQSPRESFNKLQ